MHIGLPYEDHGIETLKRYESRCQSYKAPYANYIANYMNIEDYREYCLSLGEDIEEKLPFQKFKNGEGVLVFYVMGHMFSFFDCKNDR